MTIVTLLIRVNVNVYICYNTVTMVMIFLPKVDA